MRTLKLLLTLSAFFAAAAVAAAQKPTLIVEQPHADQVSDVAFSPDGKLLASAGWDGTVKVWDAETMTLLWTMVGHAGEVMAVTFADDGKKLVSGGGNDPNVKVWDIETGELVRELTVEDWGVSLAAEPGRGRLLAAASGKSVGLWDISTGAQVGALVGHRDEVTAVDISPDGSLLLSGSKDGEVKLWRTATRTAVRTISVKSFVSPVSFSPDGKTFAFADEEGVEVWQVGASEPLQSFTTPGVRTLAFSPDGARLLSGDSGGKLILRDVKTGKTLRVFKDFSESELHFVNAVSFRRDGRAFASCDPYGKLKLWDVESGDVLRRRESGLGMIESLAFNWSDSILACGSTDESIKLWDLQAGKRLPNLTGHKWWVTDVKFVGDDKLFSSGRDGAFKSWDLGSGKLLDSSDMGIYFDGRRYASDFLKTRIAEAADGEVKLYDLATKTNRSVPTPSLKVSSLAFSFDSKLLAAGGEDGTVKLWNAQDGSAVRAIKAHKGSVYGLAFDVEGKLLATAGMDRSVRLWNPSTGAEVRSIATPVGFWTKVTFSYDGRLLAVSNYDGSVKLWEVATGAELITLISLDKVDKVEFEGRLPLITLNPDLGWVVVTPDGRFDTNLPLDRIEGLHWALPREALKALPLEIFMRQYYEPGLLARTLRCSADKSCDKEFSPLPSIADINRVQPKVEKMTVTPHKDDPRLVDVGVEVEDVTEQITRGGRRESLSSGVYDLRLFRDGQMVGSSTPEARLEDYIKKAPALAEAGRRSASLLDTPEDREWRAANDLESVVKFDRGRATYTFKSVKLPTDGRREVEFAAYAFNSNRVKSITLRKTYPVDAPTNPRARRAYVIAVGVNASEDPTFNLEFAAADARLFGGVVADDLTAAGRYAEVVPVTLVSDYKIEGGQKVVTLKQATKQNLQTVLRLLSGERGSVDPKLLADIPNADRLKEATPDDLVLIAFSGHGYADADGVFYFFPYDIGDATRAGGADGLLKSAVSSDELTLWLRGVDAGEMALVVDACHSAAAVQGTGFKPGPLGGRGLGQLSYDKGMRVLAAAQGVAVEVGREVKQGLLTYALVREGLEQWRADVSPRDGRVEAGEWLRYGAGRVPELAAGEAGNVRTPERKAGPAAASAQRPALFDFRRGGRADAVLASR